MIKLGLIGKNINTSQAPDIHHKLGELFDIPLTYELFDLKDRDDNYLSELILNIQNKGFAGVNITFPFKETVMQFADKINQSSSYVKSTNTLLFKKKIIAENTDYTGFLRNYLFHFNDTKPGEILVIGGGGVGRAITFALGSLDVSHIYLLELDNNRASNLIDELRIANINCSLIKVDDLKTIIKQVDGIINCSPIGHHDFPGCPLGELKPKDYHWIFDAVYTPAKTKLIKKGEEAGSKVISGIDLFVFQALNAFLLFTEKQISKDKLTHHVDFLRNHYFRKLYK